MIRHVPFKHIVAPVVLALLFMSFTPGIVKGAPNIGPDPDDIAEQNYYGNSYPGVERQFKYAVSRDGYTDIYSTRVIIYMPTPTGTISVQDADLCYNDSQKSGRPNYDQTIQQSTGLLTRYTMTNTGSGVIVRNGYWNGASGCWNDLVSFNVSGSSKDPATGLYPYYLNVDALANGKYVNLFKVIAPAGGYVSQDSTVDTSSFGMQQVYPIPPGSNPEVNDPPDPYKDYSTWTMRFGPDCSVTSPVTRDYVEIYDDDNSGANNDVQPQRFQIRMQEFTRAGAYVRDLDPVSVMWNSQNHTNPTTDSYGGWDDNLVVGGARYHAIWTTQNKRRLRAYFDFQQDKVYRWKLFNVYYDNTLQLRAPYDSIFYYRECQQVNGTLKAGMRSDPGQISPGQTATFTPSITVSNYSSPFTANCTIERRIYPPGGGSSGLGNQPCVTTGGDPNIAVTSSGQIDLRPNTYTAPGNVAPGSRVCDRITITNPSSDTNFNSPGDKTAESCVDIVAQPYFKVFGGDIMAGGGLESSPGACTLNNDAAIVSWNLENIPEYHGAGVQYAGYAMARISDFSTSQYGGGAPPPSGLAFANTGSLSGDTFGGNWGSMPCIADQYQAVSNPLPANVAAMSTGKYGATGNVTLGGGDVVNPGDQIEVFVDGDVYITSNIRYAGSWNVDKIPLFKLVAKGNIYIDPSVTQLDGVYIAQKDGANSGIIYTCANAGGPIDTAAANFYSTCKNKLVVNGSITADQIRLLRTGGGLGTSNGDNAAAGTSDAAEQFNFSPLLWIPQPSSANNAGRYDAITSLPPVL